MARRLRRAWFLVPNAVTTLAIVTAVFSILRSVGGEREAAAWLIVWCTLLDKADGFLARLLDAQSEFGFQLDSLADLLSFGVAPAVLVVSHARSVYPALQGDALFATAAAGRGTFNAAAAAGALQRL